MERTDKMINQMIIEGQQKLAKVINESAMPPILWSYILKDALLEIQTIANQQLQTQQAEEITTEDEQQKKKIIETCSCC